MSYLASGGLLSSMLYRQAHCTISSSSSSSRIGLSPLPYIIGICPTESIHNVELFCYTPFTSSFNLLGVKASEPVRSAAPFNYHTRNWTGAFIP